MHLTGLAGGQSFPPLLTPCLALPALHRTSLACRPTVPLQLFRAAAQSRAFRLVLRYNQRGVGRSSGW